MRTRGWRWSCGVLLLVSVSQLWATTETCLVVGVNDGDTITARCGLPGDYRVVKVGLSGIDSPEKRQAFGQRAKQAMSELVFGKDVSLECFKQDRYGRSICRVMIAPTSSPSGPKTLDSGLAMITVGMAWWYRKYAKDQPPEQRGQYEFAEFEARSKRVGLWTEAEPTPPWDWRKAVKSSD